MPKVLIADKMATLAEEVFKNKGVDYDVKTDLSPDELLSVIGEYDGLAIRSSTTVTKEVFDKAKKLKVVGRAGIGTDNIDKPAATAAGVIVMNTPFGNATTTAEHAISMMMSLARQIPQANESTHAGKWEKKKFMGTEVYNKTLGVVGCGNIGAIVADRARGLRMKVIAFDPFLTDARAEEMGVEKVTLEELFKRADFITVHTPLTDKTRGLVGAEAITQMKKGVRIINCARGGIVCEKALLEGLNSGHVAGAALDVFEVEPAKENALFGHPNVVCTPHLGASTIEAQDNVAVQIAEQISDYLLDGAITNALNMPSISAEDAPKLKPFMRLAERLGSFVGQISESAVKSIFMEYQGSLADTNTDPLDAIILSQVLGTHLDGVNMVNAPMVAKDKDIQVSKAVSQGKNNAFGGIRIEIETANRKKEVAGVVYAGAEPRITNIEGVAVESNFAQHMLFFRNDDKPGMIGEVGTLLGQAEINIGDFRLGRKDDGSAIALVSIDSVVPEDLLKKLKEASHINSFVQLSF